MTRSRGLLIVAVIVLCAIAPFLVRDRFLYHLGILICIQAILALSVNLMLKLGQLSLAQAGFMGIGAYTSALLSRDLGVAVLAALPIAVVASAVVAAVLGSIILRVRGIYFVLLTFTLGETIRLIFVQCVVPFGGNNGLPSIPAIAAFGISLQERSATYGVALAAVLASLGLSHLLFLGDHGRILRGIARNEPLMQSLGVDSTAYRRLAFTVSAAIAGLAGGLYAHYVGFISPAAFNVTASVGAVVLNVVGGSAFLLGPVVGAVLLVPLPELFRGAVAYQSLFYGLSLLALTLFLPRGALGLLGGRVG
ncbi:MAG: branched-chain amino acid ABC transporter permease [Xanthobacteraceae bacterium]|nr:branched-chain amino acid ABC transporter permease [Xanthobacteraceae bacterium]